MDLIFFIFGGGCTFGFCCCYFFNKKKPTTLRSCRTCMIDKTPLMPTHIKNCDKITEHKYLLLVYKEECLAKVKKKFRSRYFLLFRDLIKNFWRQISFQENLESKISWWQVCDKMSRWWIYHEIQNLFLSWVCLNYVNCITLGEMNFIKTIT